MCARSIIAAPVTGDPLRTGGSEHHMRTLIDLVMMLIYLPLGIRRKRIDGRVVYIDTRSGKIL